MSEGRIAAPSGHRESGVFDEATIIWGALEIASPAATAGAARGEPDADAESLPLECAAASFTNRGVHVRPLGPLQLRLSWPLLRSVGAHV